MAIDVFASGVWMGIRLIALAGWLLALARFAPADDFGWLAAVLGVCAVCTLLCCLGIPYLYFADAQVGAGVRHGRWNESLGCILASSPPIALVSSLALFLLFDAPVPYGVLLCFVLVEVACAALIQSSALCMHADGRLGAAAALPALPGIGRLVAAAAILYVEPTGPRAFEHYLLAHLVVNVLGCLFSMGWVVKVGGLLPAPRLPSRGTLAAGWRYGAMGGAALACSELDKPYAGRLAGLEAAGHYSMAYRICAALSVPATALSASMLPRWARAVAEHDAPYLRRSFACCLGGVMLAGIVVWLGVNGVTRALDPAILGIYPRSWTMLGTLSLLVGALGMHQVAGTALLALGRPLARSAVDVLGLGVLAVSMFLGNSRYGLDGIAWASVVSEYVVVLVMSLVVVGAMTRMKPKSRWKTDG
ncbi:lipopolysaccharide biosynthesis protein [Marilutibacter spongiae]|uniref:Polysaccharide biosynthesis protein n=1 Tax=Marilutibacter spongiae TaxID=2025720 RepID=A0A7W3Y4N9_9GAMM|nr:hypothetical protein [Lysobacter spongiae]MBB1059129.1 hypothetical protein [Lysobacter spongiae]